MNHSKIFLFFASFVFSSIFFLFFASNVEALAEVVINEFSPASSPEWVEIYNTTSNEVSLDGFVIYFDSKAGTTQKKVFCSNYKIAPYSFLLIETLRYLADDGDTIVLKQYDDIVDTVSYGAGQAIPTLRPNQSARRNPDGSPNWEVSNEPSKNGEVLSFSCPTTTPSPTPSPTPTPTQSSEKPKATLKINDARDQNDIVVAGATQIYIDGNYTGNYAPETYTFCDDCKCGSNKVSCGFGSHTIKVEKTGYKSWTKTIDISVGNSYEETPILTISTPTPSSTPKPSATSKTSPTPSLEAENTIQASESALTLNSSSEPRVLGLESAKIKEDKEASGSDSYFNLAAVFFIIAGLSFLSAASYAYFKSKKKKEEKQNENKDSEDREDF